MSIKRFSCENELITLTRQLDKNVHFGRFLSVLLYNLEGVFTGCACISPLFHVVTLFASNRAWFLPLPSVL